MKSITIKIPDKDLDFLINKTNSKGYFEKAGMIFTKCEIVEIKTLTSLSKNFTK